MRHIQFSVDGQAQPGGSKRAFPVKKGGEFTGRNVIVDSNPRAAAWKDDVRVAARKAIVIHWGSTGTVPFTGPVRLNVAFHFARPKGHFGTGKNADRVKASAPVVPIVKPDVTKLIRTVEDALTGIMWRDDSQVVYQAISKHYTLDGPHCWIAIEDYV